MTQPARWPYPLAVLLAGIAAAAAVFALAGRARRQELARADERAAAQAAAAVEAEVEAVARAVRGPALAFDLQTLAPREVAGVLRLSYAQSEGVTAVTLLDRDGSAVVPAVYLSRPGTTGGGSHPAESLDDLDRFARQIPLDDAVARGRALRGPYPSVHGDGARVAFAETIPVAQGTGTWVLAAEVDAAQLVRAREVAAIVPEGAVALVGAQTLVGTLAGVSREARAALLRQARGLAADAPPRAVAGPGYRAVLARAPAGLAATLAVVWPGEDERERRARRGDLGLAVVVASIVGAVAAALAVTSRDGRRGGPARTEPDGAAGLEARVLGAVVKELANPIAATAAAARVLAAEPGRSRVAETVQRSALRVERVFRRVARLARAGEEAPRAEVDLAEVVRAEAEGLRGEIEHGGHVLRVEADRAGRAVVRADAGDLALLVQVLLDGARSVAPPRSEIAVELRPAGERRVELVVRDAGAVRARDRVALSRLGEATRTEGAASSLAWVLAARIARDHGAELDARDVEGGGGGAEVVLAFERA